MIAIEFEATVKNGTIEIPEVYRNQVGASVRVIILTTERPASTGMLARLINQPIVDPTFAPLPRETMYDRTLPSINEASAS
jgi:hypothetical protein